MRGSIAAEITPAGSMRSRRNPSHSPPKPWKYHQGIPFCVLTTVVSGPSTGLQLRRKLRQAVSLDPKKHDIHRSHIFEGAGDRRVAP